MPPVTSVAVGQIRQGIEPGPMAGWVFMVVGQDHDLWWVQPAHGGRSAWTGEFLVRMTRELVHDGWDEI